jgi:GNAT superfamily N-acetyltransferase
VDFKIRSFGYEDLDQVRAIEKASFPDPYSKLLFRLLMLRVGGGFIVAQNEGVMGYAISETRGDKGHIISMAVSPEYRRVGIGEAPATRNNQTFWVEGQGNVSGSSCWKRIRHKVIRKILIQKNRRKTNAILPRW